MNQREEGMQFFLAISAIKESCLLGRWRVKIQILCFALGILFISSCTISDEENQVTEIPNFALETQAEDLNNVLPQRLDLNTSFDSVGFGANQLQYYYSISNLTNKDFEERKLYDSLYSAAVNRIPCTLWRPVHMQGVEVTFTYFSNSGEKLLHFTRQQEVCQ